jgi:TonB family protein
MHLLLSCFFARDMSHEVEVSGVLPQYALAIILAQATTSPSPNASPSCAIPNQEAKLISAVFPRISLFDRQRAEANGEVVRAAVVRVLIGPDGQVQEAAIWKTSEDDNLDKKAIAAARASKYTPKIVHCMPTPGVYLVSTPFVT